MQLILAGVNPQLPEAPNDKKPFENICPNCAHIKASQRPQSSRRLGGMMDFKIKKGNSPAALAAIKQKRKAFEQEQQDFVLDLKNQMTELNLKSVP